MRRRVDAVGEPEHRQRQLADYVEMGLERHQNEIFTHSGRDTENHIDDAVDDGGVEEPFLNLTYKPSYLELL